VIRYKIKQTPEALADTDEAFTWIHEKSPEAAVRWYKGLLDAVESLRQFPERFPLVPESDLFDIEVRHLLYKRHRIIFLISTSTIVILRVYHGSRKPIRKL